MMTPTFRLVPGGAGLLEGGATLRALERALAVDQGEGGVAVRATEQSADRDVDALMQSCRNAF